MALTKDTKTKIIGKNSLHKKDTGSPEVQVALMSERIAKLSEHLKTHKKDNSSRRGLLQMVGKRRRMLMYLKSKASDRYDTVMKKMGQEEK